MYDPRAKRPKLKATDRRPTVDVSTTSTGDDDEKMPQTIDEMRRLQNRRSQNAQPCLKPYVGKRTAEVIQDEVLHDASRFSEECVSAAETNTASSCNRSTSDSTTNCDITNVDVQSVKYHCGSRKSKIKTNKCQKNETARSVDANCLPKEKLVQYLHAVG